jgi:peptidoglycan/xylan/chitin deacetylase (PgdA/CDA1 family)
VADPPPTGQPPDDGASEGPGAIGAGRPQSTALAAKLNRASEGRDFSNLGGMVHVRGGDGSRRNRRFALTFDDGPVLQTYDVLRALESKGARGTFFLVGRKVAGHEALVRRIVAGGHEIGNHSFGHDAYPEPGDLSAASSILEGIAGVRPRLYRPPFGAVDRGGAEAARSQGMEVTLWSVDSEDGMPLEDGIPADRVIANVVTRAKPGAIALLHDGLPWSQAAAAVPDLIDELQGRGFELVTVSELLAEDADPPPRRGLRGRLRRVAGRGDGSPAPAPVEGASPDFAGILTWVAEGVEPAPATDAAGRLIAGACGLLHEDPPVDSTILRRCVAAHESDAIRVIAIGFALRRFEARSGEPSPLPEAQASRIRSASDPGDGAAVVARELSRPTRIDRLEMEHAAEEQGGKVESGRTGPQPPFLALFAPGPDVWLPIQAWARRVAAAAAQRRLRELLEAAGVSEPLWEDDVLDRLDVDFLLRFGYVLGACEDATP